MGMKITHVVPSADVADVNEHLRQCTFFSQQATRAGFVKKVGTHPEAGALEAVFRREKGVLVPVALTVLPKAA